MARTLVLIDGHYHIYRSFFAFGSRPLTNSEGHRVETAYAITNLLWGLYRNHRHDYSWAIALDGIGPTFRHEYFPPYKANREEMPAELRAQLPWIDEVIEGFGIPVLRSERYEADDLIATAAFWAAEQDMSVQILSKDKDLEQVLSARVLMNREPREDELYGPEQLLAKRGIRPDQVVDYQALVGDSSDNVPGVPGIGPKTALKVLAAVDDLPPGQKLERLLHDPAPDGIPAATLARIRDNAKMMRDSRYLVELRTDVALVHPPGGYEMVAPDLDRLQPLFMKLGFQRFVREIAGTLGEAADATGPGSQRSASAAMSSPEQPRGEAETPTGEYHLISDESAFDALLDRCRQAGRFAFDTETTGIDPLHARCVGFSVAIDAGEAFYVPLGRPDGPSFLPRAELLMRLKGVLEDPALTKVAHHLKYDAQIMLGEGIRIAGPTEDSMIAAYLINPIGGSYKLDNLVAERLNHTMIPIHEIIGQGDDERSMADLEPEAISGYAAEDADFTLRLADVLLGEIESHGLSRVFRDLEMPLVTVLVDMEREGIGLDRSRLEELEVEFTGAVAELQQKIYHQVGTEFTLNSPKQLQQILFERLGLPPGRKTKTGYSTSAAVLEELTANHPEQPVPRLLLDYRSLTKLLNTYIQALPKMLNSDTGRLHTDLRQTVAATGRLSSNKPNLQNIPVKTELGKRVRRAFVPNHAGYVLLSADYSQIELRLLAHLSGDHELRRAMISGADIHRQVAARIAGKEPEAVTREERSAAKAVNFGVIYGMGAFGLARDLGIPRSAAQEFIEAFFSTFPQVKEFIDRTIADAKEAGEVRTLFGRRRPLPELRSRMPRDRRQGERFAVNTVVQGSAADLIKKAMIDVQNNLRETGATARMLLQIHDELLFELPHDQLDREARLIKDWMEGVLELDVPLVVNVSAGEDWYDASK